MKKYEILWHDSVDSTNSEAVRRLENLDNMSVIAARSQTAGRGKDTNKWLAAPGENLTFTMVLKYAAPGGRPHSHAHPGADCPHSPADPDCQNILTDAGAGRPPYPDFPAACQMAISAATAASAVNFLAGRGIAARVKWPNDIYVGDRKICGILIEHRITGASLRASIIGVGLNLNQTVFPSCLPNPVSVALLTGRKTDVDAALEEFCGIFSSKMDSVFGRLPHLSDVIARAFASEDGASGDQNLRAGFAQCVDILL